MADSKRKTLMRAQIERRCKLLGMSRANQLEVLLGYDRADARRKERIADQIGERAKWK
jgi:hypothetical protein